MIRRLADERGAGRLRERWCGLELIGSAEAATRFDEILRRARDGETFVITENGVETARIVPPVRRESRMSVQEAIEAVRKLRPKPGITMDEIRGLIEDGRRF